MLRLYKFRLPTDPYLGGLVIVLAESVEHARELALAHARANGLWANWFQVHEPEVIELDVARVVGWAEFAR